MEVHGVQSTAMIENQTSSAKEKISDQDNPTVVRGEHFGSLQRLEIDAAVGSARDSIDDSPKSKG
jgi:hypothetical protein